MTVLCTAYLLGACVIEKHFTHDKSLPGNDHYHAMDVDDLKRFRERVHEIRTIVGGDEVKRPLPSEDVSRRNARRSLVLTRNVEAGTELTSDHLTYKRPGTGVGPEWWDRILGRRVRKDLERDHILQWEDLESSNASRATD
jgi:N-acetylneuraminate synthase